MDFTNRSVQPQSVPPAPGSAPNSFNKHPDREKKSRRVLGGPWKKGGAIALLFAVVILIAAVIVLLYLGPGGQDKYIKSNQYQAVFLTNGQVYFGHIKNINSKYIDLHNIYYLQQQNNGSSSNNNANSGNVSLVKLGCELHKPYDEMVINSQQVSFWENIQDNGQVAKAIQQYQKNNPNGQTCSNSSSTSQSSTDNNVQGNGQNNSGSQTQTNNSATKP